MQNTATTYIQDFLSIIYPNLCYVCNADTPIKGRHICIRCLSGFPYTDHFTTHENLVTQKLYGREHIENGAALINYYKGSHYADMIHRLKYEGCRKIGPMLGEMTGRKLLETDWIDEIDCIVPVPIHKIRRMKRGYNQSTEFAKGIQSITKLPIVENLLLKKVHTTSQVEKDRTHRLENVINSFALHAPNRYKNKHLLVVDDVITTGATVEACTRKLSTISGVCISVLAIAVARY